MRIHFRMARALSTPRTSRQSRRSGGRGRSTTRSASPSRSRPASKGRTASRGTRGARTGSRKAPRQSEVQAFLERFTLCMTSGDGDGATHCFELPALMVMADPKYGPSQVLEDPQKVSGFFSQAPDQYHEKGIETTFPHIESLDWADDGIGIVRARFPYVDADGNDLGDGESSIYILRRDPNGELAILTAVALGTYSDREARRKGRSKPVGQEGDQLA